MLCLEPADVRGTPDREAFRMRHLPLAAAVLFAISGAFIPVSTASAEETCTGENCPPPQSQGGGRDCESKKKEDTIS